MQVLNHTYELTTFLQSNDYAKHLNEQIPENVLIAEFKNLHTVMWTQNGIVSPNRFVRQVQQVAQIKGRQLFTGWAQNDLPEFLLFMIEALHNSIARQVSMKICGRVAKPVDKLAVECYAMLKSTYNSEYSEIMDMFYGIYVSELSSTDGQVIHSRKPESFFILDLEVKSPHGSVYTQLYECIDSFTQVELMQGDNAWFNEATQRKEDVRKRIVFWNFPTVLVITLKRFHGDDGSRKLQHEVSFPLTNLDLSRYVVGYNPSHYVYDLFGVCNHSGNTVGGHYTAYVQTKGGMWVHFNDTAVEPVPISRIVSPKAYCLFYRKKSR
jgi:ubiquitin C-terminal hydrolase